MTMSADDPNDTTDKSRAPRHTHGTRVSFSFTCAECGTSATLDYVPKGTPMDEVLCEECLQDSEEKSSRWHEVREQKKREQKVEWEITCADCERTDYLPFEPEPDREYLCERCFQGHQQPGADPVEGTERVTDTVYIRSKNEN